MGYVSDALDPEREHEQNLDRAWEGLGGTMSASDTVDYISKHVSGDFEVQGDKVLYSNDSYEGLSSEVEVNLKYDKGFLAVRISKAENDEEGEIGAEHQDNLNGRHLLGQMEDRMDYDDHRRVVPADGDVYGSFTAVENFESSDSEASNGLEPG